MPLTLVIADETTIVRRGIKSIVEDNHANQVIGEASDGMEAICQVQKFKPTVLITNLRLPRLSGLEVTKQVQHYCPDTKVIAISNFFNATDVANAFQHGVLGLVHLEASEMDIQRAIQEVHLGKRYLGSVGVQTFLSTISNKPDENGKPVDSYDMLTSREREIFQLAAEGYGRQAIAKRLFISQRTVETHRAHIMHKLQLHSQTDMVRYAIRKGIMTA